MVFLLLVASAFQAQTDVPIHLGTNMKATGNADWIGEPELGASSFTPLGVIYP